MKLKSGLSTSARTSCGCELYVSAGKLRWRTVPAVSGCVSCLLWIPLHVVFVPDSILSNFWQFTSFFLILTLSGFYLSPWLSCIYSAACCSMPGSQLSWHSLFCGVFSCHIILTRYSVTASYSQLIFSGPSLITSENVLPISPLNLGPPTSCAKQSPSQSLFLSPKNCSHQRKGLSVC